MAKELLFWRHGQTDLNIRGRIQGSTDCPLNGEGLAQAREIAPELAKKQITKIYCSDLLRAKQTAEVLAGLLHLEVTADPRLRERSYGDWEKLTAKEIKDRWPAEFCAWREGKQPEGVNVETRLACGMRVKEAVLDAVCKSGQDDVLMFVAHGGSIVNGIMCLLEMDPQQWTGFQGQDNCHWARLIPRPKANPPWRVVTYNGWIEGETGLPANLWR